MRSKFLILAVAVVALALWFNADTGDKNVKKPHKEEHSHLIEDVVEFVKEVRK